MNRINKGLFAIFITFAQISLASADPNDAFQFFQEEAKVVTASRREQSISDVPVAIDVITAEEIKASGAVHLWDLLRYRPGVNVIDGHPTSSANRAIVSVRGFAEEYARNLLVLVDGRKVYTADSGGTYWDQLPVQIQDIERIEIIRGPNAALYGSGAGLGVINIITKKPTKDASAALDIRGGNRSAVQSYESVNASIKEFAYRLSHTFRQQGGFDSTDGAVANDAFHSNKANVRSHWNPAEGSELELFAGGSWNTNGLEDDFDSTDRFNQHFEILKLSQKLGENSQIDLLSSRNDYTSDIASADSRTDHTRSYQYDEQILHQIDWGNGRMKSTYGFDYLLAHSDSQQDYPSNPNVESQLLRGYLNQTARLTPHVQWVGAFSWEASDIGKPHPNYQVSHLWEPVQEQSFRLSYSVAHTVPTLRLLNINQQNRTPPLIGNPDLKPQTLTSYEAGYRGNWLNRHLSIDSDLFYTVIDDIDDSDFSPDPSPHLTFFNINKAIARGAEVQMKYRFGPSRSVYINYTYEHITDIEGNEGEVTKNTPPHAINLGGIADLSGGFSGSFNLGYKDAYFIAFQQNSFAAPAYWRLDVRLAYTLPWYKNAELYVAGQNLAASNHQEYADGLTIPRTYQGGMSVKFGDRL